MRYEGKSEADAVAAAASERGVDASSIRYRVVRDEKSFWGGRVVEIEVEGGSPETIAEQAAARPEASARPAAEKTSPTLSDDAPPSADDWAAVEATLTELLSAAGFLVEIRRRSSDDEMVFELIGDDVEPLLANRGEGLNGLEVLTGRIAGRKLGRPVHPRLDAEGFRTHQKATLEELALRSAEQAKRTRHPQLLPPLPPAERRLVHLALAADPDVETESEGSGFLKRVSVRLKTP